MVPDDDKSSRNKTLEIEHINRKRYLDRIRTSEDWSGEFDMEDTTILGDTFEILPRIPSDSIDLIIADPPYNLSKEFHDRSFSQRSLSEYEEWLKGWVQPAADALKTDGTAYIFGDWRSSAAIHRVSSEEFIVRNRITWKREKGRGAKTNWKNSSEDIWFCTNSEEYTFNVEDVKLKRKVVAPYTDDDGNPKDWEESEGGRFRLTHPSNIWTEMTVPFWSMPENTEHPTQKPEKLLAKLILASSNPGDLILDPFLGSGTTSVVARKLNRNYLGIEINEGYCLLAAKRLEQAEDNDQIQGYTNGHFWERNTNAIQEKIRNQNDSEE